jgi:hypothetical protein
LDERDLAQLQRSFTAKSFVRLPSFLDSDLMERALTAMTIDRFHRREHPGVGVELCIEHGAAPVPMLTLATNSAALFRFVEQITGCGPIGSFSGRVFAMPADEGFYDDWHTDATHHRLVALSVNLSPAPYDGGALQLKHGGDPPLEIMNEVPGDAVLFRLDSELTHRIAPVERGTRFAYAGWFCSEPDFLASISEPLRARAR